MSPGIKKGGVVTHVRTEVELIVTAADIPDHITLDISKGTIGDVYHISDIELPKGTKAVIDRDFVIANITAPAGLGSSDDEETEEAAAEE